MTSRYIALALMTTFAIAGCSKKTTSGPGNTSGTTAAQTSGKPAQTGGTDQNTKRPANTTNAANTAGGAQTTGAAKPGTTPRYRHAAVEKDSVRVEVKELTPAEQKVVEKLDAKYTAQSEPGKHIPLTEAAIPKRYREQLSHVVMTPSGNHVSKLRGFQAYNGASEFHFVLLLEPIKGATPGPGLSLPGDDASTAPKLRKPTMVDPASDAGKKVIAALHPQVQAALDAHAKKTKKKPARLPPLTPKQVEIITGRFVKPRTYLVSIKSRIGKGDGPAVDGYHAAYGFLDANHKLVDWLIPPGEANSALHTALLLDLGGTDAIIYEDSYYEGSFTYLIPPAADGKGYAKKPIPLEGDGA